MIFFNLKNVPLRGANLFKFRHNVIQVATITGRNSRGEPLTLQKPFPYEEKKFMWYHRIMDNTMVRVTEENAKLIVVEGPVAVGKTAVAKVLAEQFDMLYMPEPTMDDVYLLPSGYDLRQHDCELPETVQTYDHKNFCINPKDPRLSQMQLQLLYLKFMKYVDALCHILNTGQGVVMERNYFSHQFMVKAMYKEKFLSNQVYNAFMEVNKNTGTFFLPPHLVLYLDIPVPVVQERIRTRNLSYEQNSPALTKEFLLSYEVFMKEEYLKKASKSSEMLVYDWTDGGDVELVIEDIEKIDFDIFRRDNRFKTWHLDRAALFKLRQRYTNHKTLYDKYFAMPFWEIPELNVPVPDVRARNEVYDSIPECKYSKGYNRSMGDSVFSIMFKSKEEDYRKLKLHLNYFNGPD